MKQRLRVGAALILLVLGCRLAAATTYYVSPDGNDDADGKSTAHAWKTCTQVNQFKFKPGDIILFARGGEWHDHLTASSDGTKSSPITYDAYGKGDKPKIWGSDILNNASFTPAGDGQYAYATSIEADSALVDHVFIPSTWAPGTLTITTSSDPRTDGKVYTACTRGNVLFSNRKSHLVFKNLIVDETAGELNDGGNQGYGVRIEGSTDVLLENCEAYHCARHHFAAINSTGFIGRHLKAGYVQPKTPGDNTAYVSYADGGAPVPKCTSDWDDISATHMEDGKGGRSLMFVSHGDNQGLITIENSTCDNKISFLSAPMIFRHNTLTGNGTLENFAKGALIEGITLLDSSTIDQWASDGIIQNCLAHLTPSGGGPTGYGTAVLCRDKANNNTVRFNTLVTDKFSCLEFAGENSATNWYGNIMIANGNTVAKGPGPLQKSDVGLADYNFYGPSADFTGMKLKDWQALGFDEHSLSGDPKFTNAAGNNFTLQVGSPCLHAARLGAKDIPTADVAAISRSKTNPNIGAFDNGR